jgi:alkylhydroperoxidase family enzyme
LAWGQKLAEVADPEVAAAVIRGDDEGLDDAERALTEWARRVATDPNAIVAGDLQTLRDGGFDDAQIFAITTYVALRLAFAMVNDALGAHPDLQLGSSAAEPVRAAVTFGRPLPSGDR